MSNEIKEPKEIKYIHFNVMIFLFIACYSDGKLSEEEALAIMGLTRNWCDEGTTDEDVHKLVMEAYDWYASLTSDQFLSLLSFSTKKLLGQYSVEALKTLIDDIEILAQADGRYSKTEKYNVTLIKQAFSLP